MANHDFDERVIIYAILRKLIVMGINKDIWKLIKTLWTVLKDLKVTREEAVELINELYDMLEK